MQAAAIRLTRLGPRPIQSRRDRRQLLRIPALLDSLGVGAWLPAVLVAVALLLSVLPLVYCFLQTTKKPPP